jgi:hypothetical protein
MASTAPKPSTPRPAAKSPSAAKRAAMKLAALPENYTPSQNAAYELIDEYSDLQPSVGRIMSAALDEAGKMYAMTLFRASLSEIGDPNRIPANAIAAAQKLHGITPIVP